jgi:hypothetical protein
MNYSTAIFLLNDDVRAVNCSYESHDGAPLTMFKTFDHQIKVDDYVVVPTNTRHKKTVVQVKQVDVEVDFANTTEIDWIIGVVDMADYQHILAQEEIAKKAVLAAETGAEKRRLRENLFANGGEAHPAQRRPTTKSRSKGIATMTRCLSSREWMNYKLAFARLLTR